MEFKKYPKREEPIHKFKVCICGHYWHKHLLGFFGLIGASCNKCMCKNYDEMGKYTFKECQELGVE